MALALVAVATMVTNFPAVTVPLEGKKQDCPRIWHFLFAAGLTTCSAGLALGSVWAAATMLNLPGGDVWVHTLGFALTGTLIVYGYWSVKRFIERFAQLLPVAQTPAEPKAIPPELLAGALRSLAPNFIGVDPLTAVDPLAQQRWLAASRAAASEMVDLLTAVDATQAAAACVAAARIAERIAQTVSETADVPQAEAQTATDAAAQAQVTAAAARTAADAGDDEQALALAELASYQATDAINATRGAAQDSQDQAVSTGLADAEMLVRTFRLLATSPGDDRLASPVRTSDRRPLTRFMI